MEKSLIGKVALVAGSLTCWRTSSGAAHPQTAVPCAAGGESTAMSVTWAAWMELAKNGGVVLGLAISIYTVYSLVEAWILRRRQQYALLKNVYEEFAYFLALAAALAKRVSQAEALYTEHFTGVYPDPPADQDSLPEDAERVSRWLVKRANHLTSYELPMEIEKIGAILNRRQADAFFALLAARRVYVQVLATRAMDLDAFPRRPGVFARFAAVAHLNALDLNARLQAFARALGVSTPALNAGSPPATAPGPPVDLAVARSSSQ